MKRPLTYLEKAFLKNIKENNISLVHINKPTCEFICINYNSKFSQFPFIEVETAKRMITERNFLFNTEKRAWILLP